MKTAQRLVKFLGGDEASLRARQKTARALGVHPETIRLWLRDGIPLERALFIEEKTDRHVTAEEVLREARQAA